MATIDFTPIPGDATIVLFETGVLYFSVIAYLPEVAEIDSLTFVDRRIAQDAGPLFRLPGSVMQDPREVEKHFPLWQHPGTPSPIGSQPPA